MRPGAPAGRGRRRRGDDGFALVAVVVAMLVLTLFLVTVLASVLTNATLGRRDQDGRIALAAARSGLDDYLSRLNADAFYWKRTSDPANPALGGAGRALTVAGSAVSYSYTVLSTPDAVARTGLLRVRATGVSSPGAGRPPVRRSLTATLRSRSFLEFVYLSDIEVVDPSLVGGDPHCAQTPAYDAEDRAALDCRSIIWKTGDVVDGPLHSNDALTIEGRPDFRDPQVETSWPDMDAAGPGDKTWLGSTAAGQLPGNAPHYAPGIALPEQNTELGTHVEPNPAGGAPGPGCGYTGATRIVLHGTTMSVLSPATTAAGTPARCLDRTAAASEQTVPIPPLVYVTATTNACTTGAIGSPLPGEAASGAAGALAWGTTTNGDCHRGTVHVEGSSDVPVTIAASDDVVVTGDLTLTPAARAADAALGLVAGSYVWVRHPVDAAGAELSSRPVRRIEAAVLALRHSFVVQNWGTGAPLGTLEVVGSIAQRMRGPVGATDNVTHRETGYVKGYAFDPRFRRVQPPYFLKPGTNQWRITEVTDG